ncbi:hypothetical protein S245_040591, partial [Arachis hypogaea]
DAFETKGSDARRSCDREGGHTVSSPTLPLFPSPSCFMITFVSLKPKKGNQIVRLSVAATILDIELHY